MSLRRGLWTLLGCVLGACLTLSLSGCRTPPPEPAAEQILDLASGQVISRDQLLASLRASDYVLLGEQHDNPRHHALRGALLADLQQPGAAVVAEQLPGGHRVVFGADLLTSLRAAGFAADEWSWPLHQPLFAAVARAGLPLIGGDIDAAVIRRIAREGESALPAALAAVLQGAPLSPQAQHALDADLVADHCGRLPAPRVPVMRLAQSSRDASLWLALHDSGAKPAVLVAGNGHVRRDYGVPRLIAAWQPAAKLISIGFLESTDDLAASRQLYTHVWMTTAPHRDDPCARP